MKKFTIIGGGIAGLTTALALRNIGIETQVFEAAPEIKPVGAGLLLAANAIKVCQRLGVAEKMIARGRLLPHFSILDQKGRVITQADAAAIGKRYGEHNFAIHRAALHETLLAELDPGSLHTNMRSTGYEITTSGQINILFSDGSQHLTDCLIVADGIHSPIRRQLLPETRVRYAGYTCWRAVIDNPGLELGGASETWGRNGRVGIVPLENNKIYWFLCINAPQNDPAMRAMTSADLQRIFADFHAPIPAMLAATRDADLIWNDIIDLKPVHRYAFGNIVLAGDAAHATTPNMGQGACQAMEDAIVLADELAKSTDNPADAFRRYEQRRLKRTHYIVNNSWNLGKISQASNPAVIALRNTLFRWIPEWVNEQQMRTLFRVDF